MAKTFIAAVILFAMSTYGASPERCTCPPAARSKDVVIATPSLIACGYVDERGPVKIRASELEVFVCPTERKLLELGALETADFRELHGKLEIVRVSNWPFGRHWAWISIPINEAVVSSEDANVVWTPRLPKPRATSDEVRKFVKDYQDKVSRLGRSWAPDEEVVGRLFAAMVSGDGRAIRLFRSMPNDVNLDGHAAETYESAIAEYEIGTRAPPN